MEILTLLKANIRRKKGTFISILLLTLIVTSLTTAIFSVKDNYQTAMDRAFDEADCGDILTIISKDQLTDDLRQKVESSDLVERVEYYDAIEILKATFKDHEHTNSQYLTKMRDGIRLFNEELSGFENEIPTLKTGEAYLPLGYKAILECDVGDRVLIHLYEDKTEELTVRGFVQEPAQGSMTIGWKQIFISDDDYDTFCEKYTPRSNAALVNIHQSEDSKLSPAKLQRALNLETKISDLSFGGINKDQSVRYSTLMPEVVLDIVLAFVLFLFMIILIILSHSIATEIEIDYVTLGILKSQGFTKSRVRALFMLQYLLAQTVGIIVGVVVSVPIERYLSKIFMLVTAVLPDRGISVGKCVLTAALILLVSAVLIVIITRKLAKISPVRAISGGREEIYFDSRLNAPIIKNALSASLSLRQFTSAKKRYIGTVFIAALLTFSMITAELMGVLLSSRESLMAMGYDMYDILVFPNSDSFSSDLEQADDIIGSYSKIDRRNSQTNGYASIEGESLYYQAYSSPENLSVLKGRAPIYDNEIIITDMVGDVLDIGIGDEVTASYGDKDERFIISGLFQSGSDSGMTFALGFNGADKIGIDTSSAFRWYVLEDRSSFDDIVNELKNKYGDDLGINISDENPVTAQYGTIVDALKAVIYSFSLIFSFVVVVMVCTRTFTQERTDIGIFKAIGFTSYKLRLSFAVRFTIVAMIGSALGIVMSVLLSAKMLGAILRLIGLSSVVFEFTLESVLIPVLTICLSFAVFAYIASRKVKKVAVRELVVE